MKNEFPLKRSGAVLAMIVIVAIVWFKYYLNHETQDAAAVGETNIISQKNIREDISTSNSIEITGNTTKSNGVEVTEVDLSEFEVNYDDLIEVEDYLGHALLFAKRQFVPSLDNPDLFGELRAGDSLEIASTRGIDESMIIPIYSENGEVAFIATYRKYSGEKYSLGTMTDVTEFGWHNYPPTNVDQATQILQKALPNAVINGPPAYSFYSDKNNPHYEFSIIEGHVERYAYVDIHTAQLNENDPFINIDAEDNDHPFVRNHDGTLSVDPESLSSADLQYWTAEAEEMNNWIEQGMLVIDDNFNILEDSRPESAFVD